MAGSPGPLGFFYFSAAKAAGYTAISVAIKKGYGLLGSAKPPVWVVGLTRTAIGLGVGAIYGAIWIYLINKYQRADELQSLFYAGLLPVRFAEWTLVIWIFFDRSLQNRAKWWIYAGLGVLCSYVLDAIGVGAAFVLPGGIWVC